MEDKHNLLNEIELIAIKKNNAEREISDKKYAPILIATIVFGLSGLILIGAIGAILRLIYK